MLMRSLLTTFAVAAALAPAAMASDTIVAADPAADQATALDGTIVWVSGDYGAQVLMRKTADGVERVPGAPQAQSYRSVDLGHDARGQLVLTYMRCSSPSSCVARRDDLNGHRAGFRGLTLARCTLSTAPALWRTRAVYGLQCRTTAKTPTFDAKRSGLYVKTGSAAPRRLPIPKAAVKSGSDLISAVDVRGTNVAAIAADIYEYAFSETVTGTGQRSFLAAASEGESDEHTRGLALAPGGTLWTLTDAEHSGDPNQAIIQRLAGSCQQWESLTNPSGPDQERGFRAIDVAVDGDATYLVVPGTGIVSHDFTPTHACP
jgi:hypothetical protein